ncbi:hypothetical protein RLIN73S_00299 [Rhodanobacter lindaniclasticus]
MMAVDTLHTAMQALLEMVSSVVMSLSAAFVELTGKHSCPPMRGPVQPETPPVCGADW